MFVHACLGAWLKRWTLINQILSLLSKVISVLIAVKGKSFLPGKPLHDEEEGENEEEKKRERECAQ